MPPLENKENYMCKRNYLKVVQHFVQTMDLHKGQGKVYSTSLVNFR